MTKVTFYQTTDGVITGFTAQDHTGYGEQGTDIVCAAISALVIHTINAIERFAEDATDAVSDEERAIIRFSVRGTPSREARLFLQALAQTLSDMQEDETYRDFIDVIYVEV